MMTTPLTAEQDCALRIAKELLKSVVKSLAPAFPADPGVCVPCLRVLDEIDRRLVAGAVREVTP